MPFKYRAMALAVACTFVPCVSGHAQGLASDKELPAVEVSGSRAPLDPNLPNTTASKTREELREQNLINPEDALKYLPDTAVRKRYIGDRNALLSGRSFAALQAARGLVYMDDYLLSNFLGRFDAPRWNMVAPEEMERVDVLYGPFSALYPGNSIGTTVVITTRQPKKFEASARITAATQQFDDYAGSHTYQSRQASAFIGDRLASGLSYSVGVNHQESTSQPMQYYTVSANGAGQFPAAAGLATAVSGVQYDIDPKGLKRAVFGASSGAIDHTIQDHAKLRLAYDVSPGLTADAFVGYWTNNTKNRNTSYLRDAAGNTVWSGVVSNGGNTFTIPLSTFAPSSRDEEHVQYGATLKTRNATGWNGSIVLSRYDILKDAAYQANNPEPVAAAGGAGNITRRDGTNWHTFEAQATYKPVKGDFGNGNHALTVGLHRNAYNLSNVVDNVSDWRANAANVTSGFNQSYGGTTRLSALYAQDAWRFDERWIATAGVRHERWQALDGAQSFAGLATVNYARRSINATSPKLSLSFMPDAQWLLRTSAGRGVRFPTVVELFQGSRTGSSVVVNDPNLQPEKSDALELTAERTWGNQQARVSIFQEDIRNTIYNQTNTAVVPNVTNTQNIQRMRARGIELAWSAQDVAVRGLKLEVNGSFVDMKVLASDNLASVGKNWVRVPRVRANMLAAYRPDEKWMASLAMRYSGRQYYELDNSDINPNTFGGVSSQTLTDLRLAYQGAKTAELALGVDNIANRQSYVFHPMPGRTLFAELRLSY